jgi:hypothetical protein
MKSATDSSLLLSNWARLFCMGKKGQKAPDIGQGFGEIFDDAAKKRWDVKLFLFLKKIRFLCFPMRLADLVGRGYHHTLIMRKK